ncbi:Uncharacterised protein [Candidatus Burarchaeum australiense]|nr:Uncharacterised protein [Candidatus Burarchaeum australiense]
MNASDTWRLIVIAVLAFSLLSFASRAYISTNSFPYASGLLAFQAGQAGSSDPVNNVFYQLSAAIVPFTGLQYFGPLMGTLSILLIYLALYRRFGAMPALIASGILVSSFAFTSFASAGIFLPASPAFLLFAAGAYAFLASDDKSRQPALSIVGALFLAAAALASQASLPLSIILALSLLAQALYDLMGKRESNIMAASLALVGVGAGIALAGLPSSTFSTEPVMKLAFINFFAALPLALPALAISLLFTYHGKAGNHAFTAILLLLSFIVAPYSAYAALFGAAFGCAYALQWVSKDKDRSAAGQREEMLFLGLLAFSILFPILYIYDFGEVRAFAFAMVIAVIGAASIKLYQESLGAFKAAVYTLALFALFSSLATGAVLAQSQYKGANSDVVAALQWAAANTPPGATIAGFGLADQISYFSHRQAASDDALVARFLLTSAPAGSLSQTGIDYLVVDGRSFDDLSPLRDASGESGVRMDSFLFAGLVRDPQGGNIYAVFVGPDSQLYAPYDTQTNALAGYSYRLNRGGESFDLASSRVLLLKYNDTVGLQPYDRMIYPGESYGANLFKLYFGEVAGMEKVYPTGEGAVRIYRITNSGGTNES